MWMTVNQEVPDSNLATTIREKSACAVGQSTLPNYINVVLDSDYLLFLHYEHGTLKDLIAALESEYTIYTKLRRTKCIERLFLFHVPMFGVSEPKSD